MGKAPSFPFYPGDWTRDTRRLSPGAKGAWIDLLCEMHWSRPRGQIRTDMVGLARMIGASVDHTKDLLKELQSRGVCDLTTPNGNGGVTKSNQEITIINRRMNREEKAKESNRSKQERHRDKKNNPKITKSNPVPSFSSSFSSSKINNKPIVRLGKNPKQTAIRILEFLNSKRSEKRGFRPTDVNLGFIIARLKEGYVEQEFKSVIAIKWREWKGTKMEEYFRPLTLFNCEKFNQYVGNLGKSES